METETTRSPAAPGRETLLGGAGNDSIDGNGGNDAAFLGAGDDTFVWDPGDGSDTVEGQDGTDTMLFNGANGAEQVDLSANGNRLRFFRDPATSRWTPPASRRSTSTRSAAPTRSPSTTSPGPTSERQRRPRRALGGPGDGATDQVIVNGTNGNDTIEDRRQTPPVSP